MSANKIAETSTSSGTGNFTLAGAWSVADSFITGNRTFNSFYGLNHRFSYMIQDKLGNWEKGVGYLSGEAVLVRETVVDNSLTTTALIDFPAGEKLVMVPTDAGSDILPKLRPNGTYAGGSFVFNNGTNHTCVANRIAFSPFLLKRPMKVSSAVVGVTTQVASTKVRFGIYQISAFDATTYTMLKVLEFGEVPSTTTGDFELSSNFNLAAGMYFTALVSNGTPAIRGQNNGLDLGLSSSAVPGQGFVKTGMTGSADALPSSVTLANSDLILNGSMPRLLIKGQFL